MFDNERPGWKHAFPESKAGLGRLIEFISAVNEALFV